ncbi:hypothetical protein [Pseudomonas sp. CGJS7]|uniref:hypothetical protein n=1 Tax=Pseudomonas sp. CGJS7 TaxID=3109348 RepID=UPI003009CE49
MKRLMQALALVGLVAVASWAQAGLGAKTISTQEFDPGGSLVFQAKPEDVAAAAKAFVEEKKWKVLYEGAELPKKNHGMFANTSGFSGRSTDKEAWAKANEAGLKPKAFLQAKTPTSAFSFGAELFVVVYESGEGGSIVAIAGSTSQMTEKKKLEGYIGEIVTALNEKLD